MLVSNVLVCIVWDPMRMRHQARCTLQQPVWQGDFYIYGAHLLPSRSLQHHSHGDLAAMQPVQAGAAMLQRLAPASPRPLAQRA